MYFLTTLHSWFGPRTFLKNSIELKSTCNRPFFDDFWPFKGFIRLSRPFQRILGQNDFFTKEVQLIMFSQCVLRFLISLLVSELRSDELDVKFIAP